MKKLISVILVLSLLCLGLTACTVKGRPSSTTDGNTVNKPNTEGSDKTDSTFVDDTDYSKPIFAEITVEDYGTITVKLDHTNAPITVENFVKLTKTGFYDGLTFHRIMEGFMMQGGDPEGTGLGGSDETIKGEFIANGVDNPLSHTRGAISMARNGYDMNSASSQFFIVHEDSDFLDGQYACFGYVTEGIEVVDAICEDSQPTDNNGTIPASAQPKIVKIVITQPE